MSRDRFLLREICDLFTAMLHAWTKVRLARLELTTHRPAAPPVRSAVQRPARCP